MSRIQKVNTDYYTWKTKRWKVFLQFSIASLFRVAVKFFCTMDKRVSRKEHSIGITEYVSKTKGFSGILKQRYSDFQVNEIDTNGNIVHLTNQDLPEDIEAKGQEITDTEMSVLTVEQWNAINDVVTSKKKKEFCIDITKKTKPEREVIHTVIMRKYPSIDCKSEPRKKGKTIMKIFKSKEDKVEMCRSHSSLYTKFVMYKEMFSTKGALQLLAEKNGLKLSCFSVAGTKEIRGITSQLVTVKGLEPRRILASMKKHAKVCVGNFSFTDCPLELGHLKGNRFRIVLRNVIGEVKDIEESLHSLNERGFINYYVAQRFGLVPHHHIGKQLLLGKWQEAVDLILEPPENPGQYTVEHDLDMARVEYKTSRDPQKAFDLIKRNKFTVEAKVLEALLTNGGNLQGALDSVPRSSRLTFLYAYPSYIWNTLASKRLSTFGFKPIVGDLVYAADSDGEDPAWFPEVDVLEASFLELDDIDGQKSAEIDPNNNLQVQRNERKVIEITDENMDKYTIYDVLLPMPGYDVKYPSNEVGRWYGELLQADGLTFDSFKQQSIKSCNLSGSYRLIMARPQDLKWRFLRYNDPMKTLMASDGDVMKNVKLPDAEVEDGTYLGLKFELSLPSSCCVTMALREITKMDMSSQQQPCLNSAGGTKSGNHEAEGEPAFKKMKITTDFKEVKFEPCLNKVTN